MKYINYSVQDFVLDENFRIWVLQTDTRYDSFWNSWLAENPDKKPIVEEARRLILLINFEKNHPGNEEFDKVWQNIEAGMGEGAEHKIDHTRNKGTVISMRGEDQITRQKANRKRLWVRSAAVFIGILVVSTVAYFVLGPGYSFQEYVTAYGETMTIKLPDNSVVRLNSNSSLKFARDWDENDHREVWLEGEAFFNVVKKDLAVGEKVGRSKFTVQTQNLNVEVLGTRFNVKDRDINTQVVLNSGKVKLEIPKENGMLNVLMQPGELVEVSTEHEEIIKKKVEPELYTSWRNNVLIFKETPLGEIIDILQHNYGLKIFVQNPSLAERKYTGTFKNPDSEIILESISTLFDVEIIRKEDQVLLINRE